MKIQNGIAFVWRNKEKNIRNGWWILLFIALIALTRPLYSVIKKQCLTLGMNEQVLEFLPLALLTMVTWTCLRLRRQSLGSIGLRLNNNFLKQLVAGLIISSGQILLFVATLYAIGGVTLELNAELNINQLMLATYVLVMAVTFEELLFRGFIFQRLIDGTGFVFAQCLFAAAFAFGHWENPGMSGTALYIATVELALASIVFGLAYYRTKSLALPIGLHFGWNFCQGKVLGFGVSGYGHEGIFTPTFSNYPTWVSGGDFGPEASVFILLIEGILLVALWRWPGVAEQPVVSHKEHTNTAIPMQS